MTHRKPIPPESHLLAEMKRKDERDRREREREFARMLVSRWCRACREEWPVERAS